MSRRDFLHDFVGTSLWDSVPVKHLFDYKKVTNAGLREKHRLALTMGGVIDRSLEDTEGLQTLNFEGYQIFETGDLAFKLIDLQNIKTSRVGIVPRRGIMSPAYIRLQPQRSDVFSPFYYWFFYAAYVGNIFNGLGGGIRQSLGPAELLEFPVPDISHSDQTAIACYLDRETRRIDGLIEKKGRFIALLKEKRSAAISHAVTKGIKNGVEMKPSDIEWIGEVPSHWKVTKLGYLGRSANGINIGGDAFGSGYPFVSYGDVYKNRELPSSLNGLVQSSKTDRISYSVKAGDILFTRTSETVEEVAFPSVVMHTVEDAVFAGFLIRFRPFKDTLAPYFAKYAFQNIGLRDFFAKEMKIVTRASLSQRLLHSLPVPLPPLDEQILIGDFLEKENQRYETLISNANRSIALLREKRAALITAAVTGKIDVRSAA